MISSEYYGKYIKIGIIIFLLGLSFYFLYSPLASLTFGISGSIISFCWLAEDLKKYGVLGYKSGIIKRYGILIILFIMSLKAELLGALLFLVGYIIGQWYMVIKIWKEGK
ncbi:MAG: hypothetical protein ACPLKX_01795 [Dictyoglomaceae bacterium]